MMKKIYEVQQLQKLYSIAHETNSMSYQDLCEGMALQFSYEFKKLYDLSCSTIHVFAGYGFNGACALEIARLLGEQKYKVKAYLFYKQGSIEDICEHQRNRLLNSSEGIALTEVSREFKMPVFNPNEIIIDGLFGSELIYPIEGGFLSLIKRLNTSGLPIVSIDIPSGIRSEYNTEVDRDQAIKATYTITFDTPRLAMLQPENKKNIGSWRALPLNINPEVHSRVDSIYHLITDEALSEIITHKKAYTKNSESTTLIIGGSPTSFGELLLSGRAALRAGSRNITLHSSKEVQHLLLLGLPEARTTGVNIYELPKELHQYQALGIGSGLNGEDIKVEELQELFVTYAKPILLDGVVIDLICRERSLLDALPRQSVLFCSEEQQELLFGEHNYSIETLSQAQEFAIKHSITVVLKGEYIAVCSSKGNVYFHTLGHALQASSGSSDVLFGITTGLVANGHHPLDATLVACGILGQATEYCIARNAEESLIASDLIQQIGKVLKEL